LTGRFTYHTFGLNIQSAFEIPELPAKEFRVADVEITYGENPAVLTDPRGKGVLYQAKRNDFLFRLETVGAYRVQEGKKITVERRRRGQALPSRISFWSDDAAA